MRFDASRPSRHFVRFLSVIVSAVTDHREAVTDSDKALSNFAATGTNLAVGGIDHAKLPRSHALNRLVGIDAPTGGVESGQTAAVRCLCVTDFEQYVGLGSTAKGVGREVTAV